MSLCHRMSNTGELIDRGEKGERGESLNFFSFWPRGKKFWLRDRPAGLKVDHSSGCGCCPSFGVKSRLRVRSLAPTEILAPPPWWRWWRRRIWTLLSQVYFPLRSRRKASSLHYDHSVLQFSREVSHTVYNCLVWTSLLVFRGAVRQCVRRARRAV